MGQGRKSKESKKACVVSENPQDEEESQKAKAQQALIEANL